MLPSPRSRRGRCGRCLWPAVRPTRCSWLEGRGFGGDLKAADVTFLAGGGVRFSFFEFELRGNSGMQIPAIRDAEQVREV